MKQSASAEEATARLRPAWLSYAYEVRERIDHFCYGKSAREKYELRIHFSFLSAVETHGYSGSEQEWEQLVAQLGDLSVTQKDIERMVSQQLRIKEKETLPVETVEMSEQRAAAELFLFRRNV